jgi:hypothetical protein
MYPQVHSIDKQRASKGKDLRAVQRAVEDQQRQLKRHVRDHVHLPIPDRAESRLLLRQCLPIQYPWPWVWQT